MWELAQDAHRHWRRDVARVSQPAPSLRSSKKNARVGDPCYSWGVIFRILLATALMTSFVSAQPTSVATAERTPMDVLLKIDQQELGSLYARITPQQLETLHPLIEDYFAARTSAE